jgi:hypothetical protein
LVLAGRLRIDVRRSPGDHRLFPHVHVHAAHHFSPRPDKTGRAAANSSRPQRLSAAVVMAAMSTPVSSGLNARPPPDRYAAAKESVAPNCRGGRRLGGRRLDYVPCAPNRRPCLALGCRRGPEQFAAVKGEVQSGLSKKPDVAFPRLDEPLAISRPTAGEIPNADAHRWIVIRPRPRRDNTGLTRRKCRAPDVATPGAHNSCECRVTQARDRFDRPHLGGTDTDVTCPSVSLLHALKCT